MISQVVADTINELDSSIRIVQGGLKQEHNASFGREDSRLPALPVCIEDDLDLSSRSYGSKQRTKKNKNAAPVVAVSLSNEAKNGLLRIVKELPAEKRLLAKQLVHEKYNEDDDHYDPLDRKKKGARWFSSSSSSSLNEERPPGRIKATVQRILSRRTGRLPPIERIPSKQDHYDIYRYY